MTRRLNFGCGPVLVDGWENVDREEYGQGYVAAGQIADVLAGLPYSDGWFEGIVANHALQALTFGQAAVALVELRRVLAPGGVLRILVPDVLGAFRAYQRAAADWPGFAAIEEPYSLGEKFCRYVTWSGTNLSVWTPDVLYDALETAGYEPYIVDGTTYGPEWLCDLDSRLGESIVVEGVRE